VINKIRVHKKPRIQEQIFAKFGNKSSNHTQIEQRIDITIHQILNKPIFGSTFGATRIDYGGINLILTCLVALK